MTSATERAARTRKLNELADYAADLAMKLQATHKAPRDFLYRSIRIIQMHREIRPELYGPPVPQAQRNRP